MSALRLFTSESVTEGHPDKICDQVSDSILDALLTVDPHSRVAVETLVTTGLVHVAGEVTTSGYVEIPAIVRDRVTSIGYNSSDVWFDGRSCGVSVSIGGQSPDIAQGVDHAFEARERASEDALDMQGAGDQGIMFGYATRETPELMPVPIWLAHRLAERLAEVRKQGELDYLRPDGKTQVTVGYDGQVPRTIETVVLSTQHSPAVSTEQLRAEVEELVIRPVLDTVELARPELAVLINPTGRFEIGGPQGDAGLTGRKIIIDTYGGASRHGGGAFSGKDPSKVDRSAAYAMRWVAKNAVAAGLADRLELQVAYAIGKAAPVGLYVESFGTAHVPDERIIGAIREVFDLRPGSDHPRPRPPAPDLREDRELRPLRPRAARVHLGAARPRRRPPRRRRTLTWRAAPSPGCSSIHRCRSSTSSSTTRCPSACASPPARACACGCRCARAAASRTAGSSSSSSPASTAASSASSRTSSPRCRCWYHEVWALARAVADRAAGNASDVLRLAIPSRYVRVERSWLAAPGDAGSAARRGAARSTAPRPDGSRPASRRASGCPSPPIRVRCACRRGSGSARGR